MLPIHTKTHNQRKNKHKLKQTNIETKRIKLLGIIKLSNVKQQCQSNKHSSIIPPPSTSHTYLLSIITLGTHTYINRAMLTIMMVTVKLMLKFLNGLA